MRYNGGNCQIGWRDTDCNASEGGDHSLIRQKNRHSMRTSSASLLHQVAIMERMGDSMRLLEAVLPR